MTAPAALRTARPALPVFTPTALPGAKLDGRTVGRGDLIERMLAFLRTAATSANRPHMLIVGPRGSGKTHALAVVLHRAEREPQIARRLAFAWIPEDAVAISSYEDLFVAMVEHLLDRTVGDQQAKQATLDDARRYRGARAAQSLEDLLSALLGDRVLVLVLENLDRVFDEMGQTGQARLRGFMETTGNLLLLASTPLLFEAVSARGRPWFGSFAVEHLEELSVEDGSVLLERIAIESGDDELAQFLTTDAARARLRAVSHLAGGSPRMWMVLAACMSIELLEDLAPLVEAMLDQLAPYYQQRLWELSAIERKLVAELCRTATLSSAGRVVHEQRGMRTVAELAQVCGIDQRVAATALGRLRAARWVSRSKPDGTDRRTTWYEVREPLLRHYLQYRETRGEPLRVIVGFLRAWYAPYERQHLLAVAEPGSQVETYLRETLASVFRAIDWPYQTGLPEDLVAGVRASRDDTPEGGTRSLLAAGLAECVALDAWRGRAVALQAARGRLAVLEEPDRHVAATTIAAALSSVGADVSVADLVGDPPKSTPASERTESQRKLLDMQARIATALNVAVTCADTLMRPRDRVVMRLLAGGWAAIAGQAAVARGLLDQAAELCQELEDDDADLRLAVDADRAYFLVMSGSSAEGRALCERTLAQRAKALGPNHPDTLRSRGNLNSFIGLAGEPERARDGFAVLLADYERTMGVQHPDCLAIRHQHAYYVGEAGDRSASRDLYADLVRDCEQILGARHPHTLGARQMHAYCVGQAGDRARARQLYDILASDSAEVFGDDHPMPLACRHQHAYYVLAAGDSALAGDLLAELAGDMARALGATHPDTLHCRRQYADCCARTGDLDRAAAVAAEVYDDARDALGAFHRVTLRSAGQVFALVAKERVALSIVQGERPNLRAVAPAILSAYPFVAMELLTLWSEAAGKADRAAVGAAVQRVVDLAVDAQCPGELGAAVIRALPAIGPARRAPWIAAWLDASGAGDDLIVARRMLRAVSAAYEGDAQGLLALPAEEQRIVSDIVASDDRSGPRTPH
jgi:hypothetical protein